MTAIANVQRKLLLISGAVDATDHDVSMAIPLPTSGRWTIVKAETNLTDQTWVAMQITTDEDTTFVSDSDTMISSCQFSKTFMTPDQRRLTFYQGEVRPGEAAVKMFDLECTSGRPAYAHARYSRVATDTVERSEQVLEQLIADGMPQKPVLELIVPVTVIG
ncbi:MAG TPA: DUF6423 family protein [Pseudonocardiaceae bacterium]